MVGISRTNNRGKYESRPGQSMIVIPSPKQIRELKKLEGWLIELILTNWKGDDGEEKTDRRR